MLKFSKTTGFKITGSETLNLNEYLVVQPDDCTDPVIWTSNSNAVSVTDGIVTVLSGGNAEVYAKCGGYIATAYVEAIVEPIEIIDDEITIQVGERYDATKLYTLQEGYNVQYKYSAIIAIEGEHTIVGKEVGTTELEIICGEIIKTVTVNVVEPTGGMVLFDNGEHFGTEFGNVVYPTSHVSHIGDIDFDLTSTYCTYAAICYEGYINFNNYDAVAITVHTENTQQTNTQIMVGRGLNPTMIIAAGTPPYTMSYEESTFSTMTNTKTQATYVFSFDALRQQDVDTGYLGICIKRGDADGHVYIDKIVVYRDGEYNSGGTVEPR
jgi:hypothetical protein